MHYFSDFADNVFRDLDAPPGTGINGDDQLFDFDDGVDDVKNERKFRFTDQIRNDMKAWEIKMVKRFENDKTW